MSRPHGYDCEGPERLSRNECPYSSSLSKISAQYTDAAMTCARHSGSISVKIRILVWLCKIEDHLRNLSHSLCLLGLFHLMENHPARTRFASEEDRIRVDMQSLKEPLHQIETTRTQEKKDVRHCLSQTYKCHLQPTSLRSSSSHSPDTA